MSIRQLTKLIPPPPKPVHAGTMAKRAAIEKKVGGQLPTELFEIGCTYGSGQFFQGSMQIFNPFDPSYFTWLEAGQKDLQHCHELWPYTPLFNPGRLFPFAIDDNGNSFYWQLVGPPKYWPIVGMVSRAPEIYGPWELSLTDFLLSLLGNTLQKSPGRFWGNDFSTEDCNFRPQQPLKAKAKRKGSKKK